MFCFLPIFLPPPARRVADTLPCIRKHLFEDLRPYVCIWNNCESSEQDFQDRRDWIRHMTSQHWRNWGCPFGCSPAFDKCRALEDHLRSAHAEELTAERLNYVSVLSARTDLSKAKGLCPICQKLELVTVDEYELHIGHHLEQLVLSALPAMRQFYGYEHENVNFETEEHEDISTKLSRLQVDDDDELRRQYLEVEIKPEGADEGDLGTPLPPGGQPDEGEGKEKSTFGVAGRPFPYSSGHQQQHMHYLANPEQPKAPVSHYSPAAAAAAYGGHFGGMMFQSQQQQPDKPYQCDQCPTAFTRNHDLKRHKRIHWALKPFQCNGCEKAFSRKDALKVSTRGQSFATPRLGSWLTNL